MSPTVTRAISSLPPGTAFARLARCLAVTKNFTDAAGMAEGWIDTPEVRAAFLLREKGVVGAGHTADEQWAGALAASGLAADVQRLLTDRSLFEAITPFLRRVPLNVNVPRQTDAGTSGGWTPEGLAAAIVKFPGDQVLLPPRKISAITVASDALFRTPGTDAMIRAMLIDGLAHVIDTLFLDPDREGSITFGSTEILSTSGSTPTTATVMGDFDALVAAIATPGTTLVWCLPRKTLARVAVALGAGAMGLPQTLFGIPVLASATSPPQIALIDAGEILYGTGGYELSRSNAAALEMSDAPTGSGIALATSPPVPVTATQLVSLWQTNLTALKQSRFVNWLRAREGSVSYMRASF